MVWELKETEEFENQYKKLPSGVRERFEDQLEKVKQNPFSLGKPLGYKWFRELKNEGYRIYYLVYDHKIMVLFVGVSDKKSQQAVINLIKNNLKIFKKFIDEEGKGYK